MFRPVLAIIRLSRELKGLAIYLSDLVVFDYIPFPSFTLTTGMTHFLDVYNKHSSIATKVTKIFAQLHNFSSFTVT